MPQRSTKYIRILAIETSCDETAIAIIEASPNGRMFRVLSNIVLSQIELHTKWGGVVPNLAKREHQKALAPLLLQTLRKKNIKVLSSKYQVVRKNKKNLDTSYFILDSILNRNENLKKQFKKYIVGLPHPNIDLIAVTQGPGLEPALWVGINFARALSFWWEKTLIGINHMEGHIVSALLAETNSKIKNQNAKLQFKIKNSLSTKTCNLTPVTYPAIALLVSGGHTELVLIKKPFTYEIIGETRDDAAGEAFDKVARILGLGYPGGPAIAHEASPLSSLRCANPKPLAKKGKRGSKNNVLDSHLRENDIGLPRPMLHTKDFDFSFSGLKTAVLYLVRDLEKQGVNIKKLRPAICKEFQDAVVEVLIAKTIRAAKQYKAKTVLLGGGVAANTQLRKKLLEKIQNEIPDTRYYIPDTALTGDNALMIATAAYVKLLHNKKLLAQKNIWKTMQPDANMRIS